MSFLDLKVNKFTPNRERSRETEAIRKRERTNTMYAETNLQRSRL